MDKQVEVNSIIGKSRYRTEINAAGHILISDEGEDFGGENLGPTPSSFLAASLAACTAITLRMYADRKGWDLQQADIHISIVRDKGQNTTNLNREIKLVGALDAAQKERLLQIANKCPVHQMLSNPINISSTLLD